MASTKNSDRRKRKYGEGQRSRTAKNKAGKQRQADARRARMEKRTQALIGQHVAVRSKGYAKPLVGTVLEVLSKDSESYPTDARRHYGKYLRVRTTLGEILASRHRCKPLKDNH